MAGLLSISLQSKSKNRRRESSLLPDRILSWLGNSELFLASDVVERTPTFLEGGSKHI